MNKYLLTLPLRIVMIPFIWLCLAFFAVITPIVCLFGKLSYAKAAKNKLKGK